MPTLAWSAAGAPTHLTAAQTAQGEHVLVGLREDGSDAFKLRLPARGHAAAAHPVLAQAVAFARRPGTFAMVIDCAVGRIVQELHASEGHHFYGHGTFSKDGRTLFTTENHIDSGQGRIGIWDVTTGYARLGSVGSGGIGPHEVVRLPNSETLAIANGGIQTHPKQGRAKLNLDTMRPNLTLMRGDGTVLSVNELPSALHQNSLRHIAPFADGRIVIAFQWQGDPFDAPSIAGLYTPGRGITLLPMAETTLHGLDGYAGSVAVLGGQHFAVTFPRGGMLHTFDMCTQTSQEIRQTEVCGVASAKGFGLTTDGLGYVRALHREGAKFLKHHNLAFDNHLIRIEA
jgi:hypothetical protein